MKQCPGTIRCRYIFAFTAAAAMAIIRGLNLLFPVTIIFMGPAVNDTIGTPFNEKDGPLTYSTNTKNLLIGSYFWGYIVTQIPGGRFAETVTAKWTILASVVLNIACTALMPFFSRMNIRGVLALRIVQGLAGGVSLPALHAMIARWAPPSERSTICSIIYSSGALGTAISLVMSYGVAVRMSWEYVFYIMASVSAPWVIFWTFLVTDYPEKHPYISDTEKTFLKSVIQTKQTAWYMPLKSILKSKPFWAIFVTQVSGAFAWYSMILTLPLYITQMFAFTWKEAIFFTALAFLCMFLFGIFLGITLDLLFIKYKKPIELSRNLSTWIALFLPTVCLMLTGYEANISAMVITLSILAVMFMGGKFSGYFINHIDIAPNYAGTLMGLSNTFATISAILISVLAEMLIDYKPVPNSWKLIYAPNIVLMLGSAMIYGAFGSSEEQPWNAIAVDEDNEN